MPKGIDNKEPFVWGQFSACGYLVTDFLNHALWYCQMHGINTWSLQDKPSFSAWNTEWREWPNGSLRPATHSWKQSLHKATVKQIPSSIFNLAVTPVSEKRSPNLTSLGVNSPFPVSDLQVARACAYSFVFTPALPFSLHCNVFPTESNPNVFVKSLVFSQPFF